MHSLHRDLNIIEHILKYCREIDAAHEDFSSSRAAFEQRSTYRNAISLCLLQIGELSLHLSQEFKEEHPEIPWKQIRGMRNFVAHQYGSADVEILWAASTEDIVSLKHFCEKLLEEHA